jgi:hypothetical protein
MKSAKQILTTMIILVLLSGVVHSQTYMLDHWKMFDAFQAIIWNLKLDTYLTLYINNTVIDAKQIGAIQVGESLRVCYSRWGCKCDVSTEVPEYNYFWVSTFGFRDVEDFVNSNRDEWSHSTDAQTLDFDTWFMLDIAFESYKLYLYDLKSYLDRDAWGNDPDFCYLLNGIDKIWGIQLDVPIDIDAAIRYQYDWDSELLLIELLADGNVIKSESIDFENNYLNEEARLLCGRIDL